MPSGIPIGLERAKKLVKDFRTKNPNEIKAELFDADEIRSLLEGAKGLRIYYGSENGEPKLVLVSVDDAGKDRVPTSEGVAAATSQKMLADGQPCPDVCDTTSGING